jgi:hypothetical protein
VSQFEFLPNLCPERPLSSRFRQLNPQKQTLSRRSERVALWPGLCENVGECDLLARRRAVTRIRILIRYCFCWGGHF